MSTRAIIDTLDFSNIKRRLATEWSISRIDVAIEEYKKFLILASCSIPVSPCPDVDRVWHDHLLHTRQYAADCDKILGTFLHHSPSTGTLGEAQIRSGKYQNMLKAYRTVFGQEPHAIWSECRPSIIQQKDQRPAKRVKVDDGYDGCDC
jgi:hypothetical protein